MENNTVTVPDMMRAREARAQMQWALLKKFPGSVVVGLCMNIAGPVKTTPEIERAFAWGAEAVRAVLAPYPKHFDREIHEKTGPEAMLCVQADALEIKRRLCLLEDGEALGRLLDIDVIRQGGEKVSRTDIGLPARRCLLCGQPAPVCARSRTHTVEALFNRANALIAEHFEGAFARRIGENAQRALLFEAAVTPKPGLVDRANAGAHRDMDVFTFIDSACALRHYFEHCARVGLAHRGGEEAACFDALRVPGLLAEQAMKRATAGVNTHKGAIFSLGIACAALGMGENLKESAEETLLRCGRMTGLRMAEELLGVKHGEAHTFGEQAYKKSGVGGVRQEAAQGFPSVRESALPRMRACLDAGLSLNDAGLCTLTALMARTQDTNALRRGGEAGAKAVQERAKALDERIQKALETKHLPDEMEEIRSALCTWDAEMIQAGISPGGCADLLALTLLCLFQSDHLNRNHKA